MLVWGFQQLSIAGLKVWPVLKVTSGSHGWYLIRQPPVSHWWPFNHQAFPFIDKEPGLPVSVKVACCFSHNKAVAATAQRSQANLWSHGI